MRPVVYCVLFRKYLAVAIYLLPCFSFTNGGCPALLSYSVNVKLNVGCFNNASIDCSKEVPIGTLATYMCNEFYTPFESRGIQNEPEKELRCKKSGTWTGLKSYESFRCKEECGIFQGRAKPLIINGIETNRTAWPWHVNIFRLHNDQWVYICGGSLIRNQVVLTAAHCVALDRHTLFEPQNFRVALGSISSSYEINSRESSVQLHQVQRIYVSEYYDPRKDYQADIAVLHLKESVEFNAFVLPVCLPNDYTADLNALKSGSRGQVAGFGITEAGVISDTLRSVGLDVKGTGECYGALGRVVSESQFCAGEKVGDSWNTVCNGDSGGGMCFSSPVFRKFYIHGIVSSGDSVKGNCQNYAVFTRVYNFVFWIRDVIEEISGEIARDLRQLAPYPYALRGSESKLADFNGVPREWENRITSLDITYARVNRTMLLQFLEFAKPLTKFILSNVKLEEARRHKTHAVLPFLTKFKVDILDDDFDTNELEQSSLLNSSYLKRFLFFEKRLEEEWSPAGMTQLEVNIDLTIGIFKVIRINAPKGEIFLNQVDFANSVLKTGMGIFLVKNLALRKCSIEVNSLTWIHTLTQLTLIDVSVDGRELVSFVRQQRHLTHLVLDIDSPKSIVLDFQKLPVGLRHLSVSHLFELSYIAAPSQLNLNLTIPFQGHTSNPSFFRSSEIESLCCQYCRFGTDVVINFNLIFPKLKTIVLQIKDIMNVHLLLSHSQNLQTIFLKNDEGLGNFVGIDMLTGISFQNLKHLEENSLFLNKKNASGWKLNNTLTSSYFNFGCNDGKYFWTSNEDFESRMRLKTFERKAYNTRIFNYAGKISQGRDRERFDGIPLPLQERLTEINLKLVEITPRVLTDSVRMTSNLKWVRLQNVFLGNSVEGNVGREVSVDYKLERLVFPNLVKYKALEFVSEYLNGNLVSIVIPFQHIGRYANTNSTNSLHRLFINANSIQLRATDHTAHVFVYNSTIGEVIRAVEHVERLISAQDSSHPVRQMIGGLQDLIIAQKNGEGILPDEAPLDGFHKFDRSILDGWYNNNVAKFLRYFSPVRKIIQRILTLPRPFSGVSLAQINQGSNAFPHAPYVAVLSENSINPVQVYRRLG